MSKMQRKQLKLSAVLLLILGLTGLQAQTMYVKQTNGTQTAYALSSVRKMTFSGGNVTVTKTNNSTGVFALNALRYMNFTDLSTSIEKPLAVQNQMLSAYPIPASNVLNVNLTGTAQGEGTLSILNFEGKTVLSRQISHAGVLSLDIGHLPKGIYLCQYSNATELKTVKIIKQ
jgi:hypothetical protein